MTELFYASMPPPDTAEIAIFGSALSHTGEQREADNQYKRSFLCKPAPAR